MSNSNLVRFIFETLDIEFDKLNKAENDDIKTAIMENIKFIQDCAKFRSPDGKYFYGNNTFFLDKMYQAINIGLGNIYLYKNTNKEKILLDIIIFIQKCIFIVNHPDQDFIHKNLNMIDIIYEEQKTKSLKHYVSYK